MEVERHGSCSLMTLPLSSVGEWEEDFAVDGNPVAQQSAKCSLNSLMEWDESEEQWPLIDIPRSLLLAGPSSSTATIMETPLGIKKRMVIDTAINLPSYTEPEANDCEADDASIDTPGSSILTITGANAMSISPSPIPTTALGTSPISSSPRIDPVEKTTATMYCHHVV